MKTHIDLSNVSEQDLARWARARIQADYEAAVDQLDRAAGVPSGVNCDIGLSMEAGAVLFRDVDSQACYTLAPPDTLIGQRGDGLHVTYRHGTQILDTSCRVNAAHLN